MPLVLFRSNFAAINIPHNMKTLERICAYTAALASCIAAASLISCQKESGQDTPEPVQEKILPEELDLEVCKVFPSGENACVDSYLTLEFGSAPTAGTQGRILVKDSDGKIADMIDMADIAAAVSRPQLSDNSIFTTAMDAIGTAGYYRVVYYDAVTVEGNTVTIRLHNGKLDYGKTYSIEIEQSAISADGFSGIKEGAWTFTVMPSPQGGNVTVGERGCDFMTVQGAINYAVERGQSAETVISVSDGIYCEPLYIRNKDNLTIKGESKEGTIIRFDNCNSYANGTGSAVRNVPEPGETIGKHGGRSVMLVENCDMLTLENLTLENSHGHGSQAETIYFNCENGRLIAKNCIFTSEQDTIEMKGWCLFRDCLVRGDVDFIWGYPDAALFESCEIRSCANENGGYIVQARCGRNDKGIVFLKCRLTAESEVGDGTIYLARSGGNSTDYDNVTYANCNMGSHIAKTGWFSSPAPNPSTATAENGWKEYRSMNISDVPMDLSARYSGMKELSQEEYEMHYKDAAAVFSACPKGYDWAM